MGQEHVGRILTNAIQSGRVGHAYLFVGPRGVGKTTTARIFAKALNCQGATSEHGTSEPCGTCASCVDITAGVDLDVVEMDAASNNAVDDVRRLREQVGYATVRSRHRIWIVDEVHMLSGPAFNAFLKTLEEPPDGVKFIFCTTEEHKLPDTFRSRCQRVEFRPIEIVAMADRLRALAEREGVGVEDGLCEDIAAAALGGLRDAESLLEQLIAASPEGTLARADLDHLAGRAPRLSLAALLDAVEQGEAGAALDAVDLCLEAGAKPGVLLEQWMDQLRQRLLDAARAPREEDEGRGVVGNARALDVLLEKRMHLRSGADGTLVCQVAAVELARLPDARDLDRLIAALTEGGPDAKAPRSHRPGPGAGAAAGPAKGAPAPSVGSNEEEAPAPPTADAIRARWADVVRAATPLDARLAEALDRGRPGELRDGRLEVHVARHERLAQSALGRREAILLFRKVTQALFSVPLAPLVVIDETIPAPARDTSAPHEHPVVRMVAEKTSGRLLNVEKPPPPAPAGS